MTPTREDLELYVTGNFDGDVDALERAIASDPSLAAIVAEEASLEMVLRDAAAAATFCVACDELVRGERCESCGVAVRPGGYVVERVLVGNAHGRMYVVRDADGKRLALKELAFVQSPSAAAIAAFEREAKFLRALEHPAIPRFCASFEEGRGVHTRYYLAQELVDGKSLDQLDDHWYTEPEIVDIARQVLEILVYLQALSPMVIHRDIKPANLVRRRDGSIALVDFGAAHVHGTTAGVTTIGTFGYMPIEQLAGIVDATTDLYALGASLLYLLTRVEPWRLAQTTVEVNASAALRAFLDKLVARDPSDRFASAAEALAALHRRHEHVPVRKQRRLPRIGLAVTAAAGIAAGAGVFSLVHESNPTATAPVVVVAPSIEPGFATLRIMLPEGQRAILFIDGNRAREVSPRSEIKVTPGLRQIKLVGVDGARCESELVLTAGKTTTVECIIPAPAEPRLKLDKVVMWSFTETGLHDVMRLVAQTCGVNIVVAETIDEKITVRLTKVACDAALEALLESSGLWYVYRPEAHLLRIAPRNQLHREAEAKHMRERFTRPPDEPLPNGKPVDLNFKNAPLRDVLATITGAADGGVNLIVPESIDGRVTVRLKAVPWNHALEAVLDSYGLWYRYRAKGKMLRIAPRTELDAEDEAAFEASRFRP